MTARHVVAILIGFAGIGVVGAVITSAVRRLIDWRDERDRRSPVYPAIQLPPRRPAFAAPLAPPAAIGRATVVARPRLTLPALATLVDFIAQEAAVQRALAYELTSAPIWSEVEAGAELRRLAVSAA